MRDRAACARRAGVLLVVALMMTVHPALGLVLIASIPTFFASGWRAGVQVVGRPPTRARWAVRVTAAGRQQSCVP